jgi:hypothetical protein
MLFGYYLAWAGAVVGVLGFSSWNELRGMLRGDAEEEDEEGESSSQTTRGSLAGEGS